MVCLRPNAQTPHGGAHGSGHGAGATSSSGNTARKPWTTLAGPQGLAGKGSLHILLHLAGTRKLALVWSVHAALVHKYVRSSCLKAACSAASASASTCASVHPLGQVIAGLQRGGNLLGGHLPVLGDVLGVLPLEELHAVLCDWLAPEVAVRRGLLILRLTQRE